MSKFLEIMNQSLNENRGVTFYVGGQSIPGLVREIIEAEDLVIASSQMFDQIVIRISNIDAIAL